MSELEVKKNTFYVLRVKQQSTEKITLHDDLSSSVGRLKEALKNGTSPDLLELMSIDVKSDKFEIKGVPWSIIASELVK